MIKVICYDNIELWHSRKTAMEFFKDCIFNSEGAERDRYVNVYFDLEEGLDVCEDGASWPLEVCEKKGWYLKTDAPDGSRDFGGKIWDAKFDEEA